MIKKIAKNLSVRLKNDKSFKEQNMKKKWHFIKKLKENKVKKYNYVKVTW